MRTKESKEKPIMETLKESLEGWELSVEVRNKARLIAKKYLKEKETELKQAKKVLYQTNKAWTEARKEVKKAKNKLVSYPSYKRYWARKNMGKVINGLLEEKE